MEISLKIRIEEGIKIADVPISNQNIEDGVRVAGIQHLPAFMIQGKFG
jgi:hypothetical protein